MPDAKPTLAILGGTGALGSGLAKRWARAGLKVVIGSRSFNKAQKSAEGLIAEIPGGQITGLALAEAAEAADIIVLTVPYANQQQILEVVRGHLAGKILIDATVPLQPPKVGTVQLPNLGSAAEESQVMLGDDITVVSAFHNIGAEHLRADHEIDCDVLVAGNNAKACETVIGLVETAGLKAWHAGPLANSAAAEALTSVLIHINRRYKIGNSGIRITSGETVSDVPQASAYPDEFKAIGLRNFPLVSAGDNLVTLIINVLKENGIELRSGDIIVIAQKIVSKAEGRTVLLSSVMPSDHAVKLGKAAEKDPRLVELMLSESDEIVRHKPGVIIVAHKLGLVLANAGIDQSNVEQPAGDTAVLLLPEDPDRSADALQAGIKGETGADVGIIISDSLGRAWRMGTVGHAIGVSGVEALRDLKGDRDLFDEELRVTEVGTADEIAAAASLIMGQTDQAMPVVIVRGLTVGSFDTNILRLLRTKEDDLFR
jgi:coenzyme F420-0:L-glutamate ligase/coenzyme F420-1:gamma-L-glutamate ligase